MSNATVGLTAKERLFYSFLTSLPCGLLLFVNITMMFTLRSRAFFRETSRYVLLFNLLFADTLQMALAQLLYLISMAKVLLSYPVCGFLVMLTRLSDEISPLTLVLMSLERYVAVCWPLRHASIATIRNTLGLVGMVWSICSLNILTRVLLMLEFPFTSLPSLIMKDFCHIMIMFLGPKSEQHDSAYTVFVFVLATAVNTTSYVGVTVAARLASTDKALAGRARNTLLLHLVQLGLCLSATLQNAVTVMAARVISRKVLVRILNVLYAFVIMLPKCLSSLIYGIRDKSIRPVLLYHLCRLKTHSARSPLA